MIERIEKIKKAIPSEFKVAFGWVANYELPFGEKLWLYQIVDESAGSLMGVCVFPISRLMGSLLFAVAPRRRGTYPCPLLLPPARTRWPARRQRAALQCFRWLKTNTAAWWRRLVIPWILLPSLHFSSHLSLPGLSRCSLSLSLSSFFFSVPPVRLI